MEMVVLSTSEAISDLFDRRSAIQYTQIRYEPTDPHRVPTSDRTTSSHTLQ